MIPTLETKISSPSAVIKIVSDVHAEKNADYFNERNGKELEKGGRERKESSSTQTSFSYNLLHKRKTHSHYVTNAFFKPVVGCNNLLFGRSRRSISAVSQKIISAKFLRVKQLQNELMEAHKKIMDLQGENKTLRSIHKRQDSALRKYESQDSSLPQLMKSHEEEIRVLTLRYKKLKSVHSDLELRYNKQSTELATIRERYKNLLQISRDRQLLEREHLTKQVDEMKIVVNDLKDKIKLQSRRLELETKNYRHQLSMESIKQKTLQEQLKQSQDTIEKLQNSLKLQEKERSVANSKVNHIVKLSQVKQPKSSFDLSKSARLDSISDDEYFKCISAASVSEEKKENDATLKNTAGTEEDISSIRSIRVTTCKIIHESHGPVTNVTANPEHTTPSTKASRETPPLSVTKENRKNSDKKSKSDSNNNFKSNDTKESAEVKLLGHKTGPSVSQVSNYSSTKSEFSEKTQTDETSSEKSDDFKTTDETISWIEMHEKIAKENDDMNDKLDQFCEMFSLRPQKCERAASGSGAEKKIALVDGEKRKNVVNNDTNHALLPNDKKNALLQALEMIDLEKTSSNSPDTVAVEKRNDKISKSKEKASKRI